MNSIKKWRIGIPVLFGLLILPSVAQSQQQSFQVMGCSSGTFTTLSESRALTIYNIVGKGIAWGLSGDKYFQNMVWQFVAVVREVDGNKGGVGYYKFTDPEGDYFILEATGATVLEGGTWNFIHGIGKWMGVSGQVRGRFIMQGKPIPVETEQYWCRIIGTVEPLK